MGFRAEVTAVLSARMLRLSVGARLVLMRRLGDELLFWNLRRRLYANGNCLMGRGPVERFMELFRGTAVILSEGN